MDEKMKKIVKEMQGLTYLEWTKLRMTIDRAFDSEAHKIKNNLELAAPEELEDVYKLVL